MPKKKKKANPTKKNYLEATKGESGRVTKDDFVRAWIARSEGGRPSSHYFKAAKAKSALEKAYEAISNDKTGRITQADFEARKKPKKKKEKSVTWNDVSKNLDSAQKQWIKRWK